MKTQTQLQKISRITNWITGCRMQRITANYELPFLSKETRIRIAACNSEIESIKKAIKREYREYRREYYETLHKAPTETSN